MTARRLLQRAAVTTAYERGGTLRLALQAAVQARRAAVVVSADDRIRLTLHAERLRARLDDEDRRILDLACGEEPDAGQIRVVDVATAWMGKAGVA